MLTIEAGRIIGEKYELIRLLGQGSMGEVWVAHHRTLNEQVALKLLTRAPACSEVEDHGTAAARFRFEAQIAARLSRKTRHIVRVTDHGEEPDGMAYLVMELLEGQTLEKRVLLRSALSVAEVSALVAQVGRALEEAHAEGIVHRDLKPANVFLTCDEDGGLLVKLLDFGIARTLHTHRIAPAFATGAGLVFGTPGYMSPEQACAAKLDSRCDLWALATVAYEALTGELPISGVYTEELLKNLHAGRLIPVHERDPTLPEGLADFFARAFASRIELRFASASALASAFERAVRPGGSHRATVAPVPASRRGDTLPMALDSRHDPKGSRSPWRPSRWFAFAAPVVILLGFVIVASVQRSTAAAPTTALVAPNSWSAPQAADTPGESALPPASPPGLAQTAIPASSARMSHSHSTGGGLPWGLPSLSAPPLPAALAPGARSVKTPHGPEPAPAAAPMESIPIAPPSLPAPAAAPAPSPRKPINKSEVL